LQKPFEIDDLVDTIEDKGVYEELSKLNVKIKELKDLDVTRVQLVDLLAVARKATKCCAIWKLRYQTTKYS
jgi:hypothetical protein